MSEAIDIAAYIAATAGAVMLAVEAGQKRKRKYWINPSKRRRDDISVGSNTMLNKEVFSFEEDFRMTKELFQELISYVENDLTRQDTIMRKAITVQERMIVTMKYLACGKKYSDLEKLTNISKSAICKFIQEVCSALQERLHGEYMKFPTSSEEWMTISQRFASKWEFPFCLGALAGRHTALKTSRIDVPKKKGRGTDALQILALVDADYKFILADIFRYNQGRQDDIIYSVLMKTIEQSKDYFPHNGKSLKDRDIPYMFIADETFAKDELILTPYSGSRTLNNAEREYNRRLIEAQDVANVALAVLTERFRILYNDTSLYAFTIECIFKACVVLHNFLVCRSKEYLDEMLRRKDLPKPRMLASCSPFSFNTEVAERNREKFVNLFLYEGGMYVRDPLV